MKSIKCFDCGREIIGSSCGWTKKLIPFFKKPSPQCICGELVISKVKWRTEYYCMMCTEKREIKEVFG